jgi:hypothetical protein
VAEFAEKPKLIATFPFPIRISDIKASEILTSQRKIAIEIVVFPIIPA